MQPTAVAAAIVIAASLAPAAANAESVLRIRPFGDVKTLDPITNTDYMVRNHGYFVYDTLFGVDDKLAVKGQMVESWQVSADNKVWTFKLRDGLAFHDGQPETASDVVASMKRWCARDGLGQQLLAHVATLEVIDAASFRMTLNRPWGLVLDALGKPSSNVPFIMPARIAATPPDKNIDDPTGSGPFIMKRDEWNAGSRIVYVRNPAYVPRSEPASGFSGGKRAGFDRVELLMLPDVQTAMGALIKGEIDIFEEVPPDLQAVLRKRTDVKLARQDQVGQQQVFRMNSLQPPFNNAKLRLAVGYVLDQKEMLAAIGADANMGVPCPSFYMCSSPYFTAAGWPKLDLERARALVRESGYDGTPVVLLDPTENGVTHAQMLVLDQELRSIGLKTDVQAMDWGTVTSRRTKKEPVGQGGWSGFVSGPAGPDMMEPLGHMALRSNCDGAWFGWPCDAQIETLRAAFGDTLDLEGRKKIAEQVQLRAVETAPYWPVMNYYLVRGYRANLSGLLDPPATAYWNVTRQ